MTAVALATVGRAVSLYEHAFQEAERHKWIESQKHGYDRGDCAIHEWYGLYWRDFCRRKRLEHLRGEHCWEEFGQRRFGDLLPLLHLRDPLIDRLVEMLDSGMENLDVINWALDRKIDMARVIEVLAIVDVNGARLDPGLS